MKISTLEFVMVILIYWALYKAFAMIKFKFILFYVNSYINDWLVCVKGKRDFNIGLGAFLST